MTSENVIFRRLSVRSASYTSGSIRIERPSPARGIITILWSLLINLSYCSDAGYSQTKEDLICSPVFRTDTNKRKCREISKGKFRFIPMAATDTQERGKIQRGSSNFNTSFPSTGCCFQRFKLDREPDDIIRRFMATDIL